MVVFSLSAYLVVCPLVFLAGFVDAIAGGGGIISLPAYLLAGLPVHNALATNKFSSFCGGSMAAGRYIRHQCFTKILLVPAVAAALTGSALGAHLVLLTDDKYLQYLLLFILPLVSALVLFRKDIIAGTNDDSQKPLSHGQFSIAVVAAFLIGMYDGFYGPGTGTFLTLIFTGLLKMDIRQAAGNTKCINWASNAAALTTFIVNGRVMYLLGAAAAVCSIAGNYAGSGLVIKSGAKFVRPVIIFVLALLFVKILWVRT